MTKFRPIQLADIHVEPGRAPTAICVSNDNGPVWGTVFFHGVAAGVIEINAVGGQCSSEAIARAVVDCLAEPLLARVVADALATDQFIRHPSPAALLRAGHPAVQHARLSVTVAVCTKGRPDDLARCLAALLVQDYPVLDCVVIDNEPADPRVRALLRGTYPTVRYIAEPRPGLSWARNRAVLEAKGEILAFTDDDAVADPGWITALVRPFVAQSDVALVAGVVVPAELETGAQLLFERHGGLGRGFSRRWLRAPLNRSVALTCNVATFGAGANIAVRHQVLQAGGGFDPALGAGTRSAAGEELDVFFRVLKAGYTMAYEPAAVVRHKHRRSYAELSRQLGQWLTGWLAAIVRLMGRFPDERLPLTYRATRLLLVYFPYRLATATVGTMLSVTLVASEWKGAWAGLLRYPRAQRDARRIAAEFSALPTLPSEPVLPRLSVSSRLDVHHVTVDLDHSLPERLVSGPDVDRVVVTVKRSVHVLGRVEILTGGFPIGRQRLCEEIARTLALQLVPLHSFREVLLESLE